MVQTGIYAVLCLCAWGLATLTFRLDSKNQYVVQLEQNGAYDFIYAFRIINSTTKISTISYLSLRVQLSTNTCPDLVPTVTR